MSRLPRLLGAIKLAITLSLLLFSPLAFAQQNTTLTNPPRVDYGVVTDFNSDYAWRGIVLDSSPSTQYSIWISTLGFTFTGWTASHLMIVPDSQLDEAGVNFAYDRDWKRIGFEPSVEFFMNCHPGIIRGPNTIESRLKLFRPLGPLTLFTTQSVDVLAHAGGYFGEAGARYDRPLKRNLWSEFVARSGWASGAFNQVYIGVNRPALNYVGMEASLTYWMNRRFYLQPHVAFNDIVDHRLHVLMPQASRVHFGLTFGFGF